MDRDPNDPNTSSTGNLGSGGLYGTSRGTSGAGAADSASATSHLADMPPATPQSATSPSQPATHTGGMHDAADRARDAAQEKLGEAREQLGDATQKARNWKHSMESNLADRLQAGASKLREKASSMRSPSDSGGPALVGATAGATAGSGTGTSGAAAMTDRARSMEQNLARGMDATADWLRNGDLQSTVENQARTNPTRTLLVALGLGYLLGKAIRR